MDHFHRPNARDIVAFVPLAVAVNLLLYVLIGTDGRVWASAPSKLTMLMVITINLAGYCAALLERSIPKFLVWCACSLLIATLLALAMMQSPVGSGLLWSNQAMDMIIWISLLGATYLLWPYWRFAASALIAVLVVAPIVALTAYKHISQPVYENVQRIDYDAFCVLFGRERVLSEDDIALPYYIGEHTARLVMLSESGAYVWSYSERRFQARMRVGQMPGQCREPAEQSAALGSD